MGFRALAHVGSDETRLISRRGNVYKRFTELAAVIYNELDCEAVLDGGNRVPGRERPTTILTISSGAAGIREFRDGQSYPVVGCACSQTVTLCRRTPRGAEFVGDIQSAGIVIEFFR